MKKAVFAILAVSGIVLAGCSKEEAPELELGSAALNFSGNGGSQTITVDANKNWTATNDGATWYTLDVTSGNGAGTVTVTAEPYGGLEPRTSVVTIKCDGLIASVEISQNWKKASSGEFLFEEIFFAGNLLSDNSSDSGDGDQFFRITNNSDKTLYIDGLFIAISDHDSQTSSVGAYYAYPELKDSISIGTLYQIPGSGNDYPVEPGESKMLALTAQNFKAENGAGFDLSKADFEFYDENDYVEDYDNPDVPNMINWFKSSVSVSTLHNRGYESYALIQIPSSVTQETFLTDYAWKGTKIFYFKEYVIPSEIQNAWLVPNEWVLDAVNCAVDENLYTLAFNASVDAGYTNVSTVDKDNARYGKSVLRKKANGRLVDSNNSTNDFEVAQPLL